MVFFGRSLYKSGRTDMAPSWLLSGAGAIEAATGIALIIFPQAVAHLLLSADLANAGIAVGRVAGIALLSLGLVCWISRRDAHQTAVVVAMLTYNSLVTAYLLSLGIGGGLIGLLLWPAITIHAVLTLLFAYMRFSERQPTPARLE
jgi:hypothetical protein